MRASATAVAFLLPLVAFVGCVGMDDPEESTAPPDESTSEPTNVTETPTTATPPAEPTPTTATEPTPASPFFPSADTIIVHPPPAEETTATEPAPPAEPAPAPPPADDPPADDPPADDPPADDPPADDPPADDPPADDPPADDPPEEDEPDTSWPREGSYVTVRGRAGESYPSTYSNQSEWTARWTYRDGDWRGTCEGTYEHDWDDDLGPEDDSGSFRATYRASDPPHWPLFNTRDPPDEGEEVEVWLMWDCEIGSAEMIYSGIERGFHTADDTEEAEEHYSDFDTRWDPDTGLVLSWSWSRSHSHSSGTVETDAPGL